MSGHTPGPWGLCHHLESAESDASCPCGYRGGIWGPDGDHIVCEMGGTNVYGEEGLAPPRYSRPTELANARLITAAPDLLEALQNAAATIGAVYQWLDMVKAAGGATSISGIAKCHAMLKSLEGNRDRAELLVMAPARAAIAKATVAA